jgi:hypothetical protein
VTADGGRLQEDGGRATVSERTPCAYERAAPHQVR